MKKLEDIPRKNIFEVPDGYFDKLPGIIQSRVASRNKQSWPVFTFSLRLAVSLMLVMAIAAVFWLNQPNADSDPESILSSVQTEDLVAYLGEADLTTDELLDYVKLDAEDASQIEGSVYELQLNDHNLEDILNEIEQ
jgi:hypothetical protein